MIRFYFGTPIEMNESFLELLQPGEDIPRTVGGVAMAGVEDNCVLKAQKRVGGTGRLEEAAP
jgi:hypothetical protein